MGVSLRDHPDGCVFPDAAHSTGCGRRASSGVWTIQAIDQLTRIGDPVRYSRKLGQGVDKNERRQQILLHARDVFARRGYHAAKIDEIVGAAGVARGTFYLYFEDKRAIFEEIVDRTPRSAPHREKRVRPGDP